MKKDQIKIGNVYAAKVTDKVVPVRIDKENPRGGWDATNLHTNRQVCIKSAQRLRSRITVPANGNDTNEPKRPVKKKLTAKERAASASVRTKMDEGPTKEPARNTGQHPKMRRPTGGNTDAKTTKRLSGLDAAAQILAETGEPMNCKDLIERMLAAGLWQTAGKTPANTLSAAVLREIKTKGDAARFIKAERGKFAFRGLAKGA